MKNSLTRKGLSVAGALALLIGGLAAAVPGNAAVTGNKYDANEIYAIATESDNVYTWYEDFPPNEDDDEVYVYVREGVKSESISAQLMNSAEEDLAVGGIRVRATFSYGDLNKDESEFSVSGATRKFIESGSNSDDIVAYATTNSDGIATFNFTNSGAVDNDYVDVYFDYLVDGSWYGDEDVNNEARIEWETPIIDDFQVNDEYMSGSSATLTYTVTDQFGAGISRDGTDAADRLEVTIFESSDLIDPQTKPVASDGTASFTVSNPSEAGEYITVIGALTYVGATYPTSWDDTGDADVIDDESTDIYRNGPTTTVDPDDDRYDTEITYGHFADGNYSSDSTFAAFVDEAGVYGADNDDYTEIQIQVDTTDRNEDVAGAAYQPVTISGAGLYFAAEDQYSGDWIFKSNSITTETDDTGYAYVYVYSHLQNEAGQTVTITSGGKSKTVKVHSFMNSDIYYDNYWDGSGSYVDSAVLTWNWDKATARKGFVGAPGFDTTYNVTVTAKDVWGNILNDAEIYIDLNDGDWSEDPEDSGGLKIIGGLDDGEDDNDGYVTTGANGKARFEVKSLVSMFKDRKEPYSFDDLYIETWSYDDGTDDTSWDFSNEAYYDFESGAYDLSDYIGYIGPQAQAVAGAKGVVRAGVFNAKGKTVKVFVGGKLVKTVTAKNARFVTRVTGVKAGDKRVTIWVGKQRMFSQLVTVK